eukprot:1153330-Pelagomonas_calceolata.AAC.4
MAYWNLAVMYTGCAAASGADCWYLFFALQCVTSIDPVILSGAGVVHRSRVHEGRKGSRERNLRIRLTWGGVGGRETASHFCPCCPCCCSLSTLHTRFLLPLLLLLLLLNDHFAHALLLLRLLPLLLLDLHHVHALSAPAAAAPAAPAAAAAGPKPTTVNELRGTTVPFTTLQHAVNRNMLASLAVSIVRTMIDGVGLDMRVRHRRALHHFAAGREQEHAGLPNLVLDMLVHEISRCMMQCLTKQLG